mmetsp:Transcript_25153/g.36990  ORF Transcript_25153/g.36990 Transcript_25153/m.36990 type:complete len:250 (-) Transcript_25153:242-991(-)
MRRNSSSATTCMSSNGSLRRAYSGMFGQSDTEASNPSLLPFELTRNFNTEWIENDSPHASNSSLISPLLIIYLLFIAVGQLFIMVFFPIRISWTITNCTHGLITIVYLHWIKGSPNFYDVGGEMNGMTLWEQLDCTDTIKSKAAAVNGSNNAACPSSPAASQRKRPRSRFTTQKLVLLIVPTILCHVGCHFCDYEVGWSLVNVFCWCFCIVAKMPFMHGVRLFGVNRTAGIDDCNSSLSDDYTEGRKMK